MLNVEPPVAGHVDQLMSRIWSCLGRYDKATGLQLLRKRNSNEDSATTRSSRPDLLVSYLGALLFKGKDKTDSSHMNAAAMSALTEKLKSWGAAVLGKVGAAKVCLSCKCFGLMLNVSVPIKQCTNTALSC